MKRRKILTLLIVSFLASSCDPIIDVPGLKDDEAVVNFTLNYRIDEESLPSGYKAIGDDLLYKQVIVKKDTLLTKPEDPFRYGFLFGGWFKDKNGKNEWNFASDLVKRNLFLYAKWQFEHEDVYEEPEYVVEERIDETMQENIRLEGICNFPITDGVANVTKAAVIRLEKSSEDCLKYLNYVRKEQTEIISATYNKQNRIVTLVTKYEEEQFEINVLVVDITGTIPLTGSYETKAQKYENGSEDVLDNRVILGGSSSMENWETSTEDLDPIISYNFGIGGTVVQHWLSSLAARLFYPFSPKAIVIYLGINNIISYHDGGQLTGELLVDLFREMHKHLPHTQIYYVQMNIVPNFMQFNDDIILGNQIVTDYANEGNNSKWLIPIDAGTILLKPNGIPSQAYFLTDGLHLSTYGYVLWGGEIKKALMANL